MKVSFVHQVLTLGLCEGGCVRVVWIHDFKQPGRYDIYAKKTHDSKPVAVVCSDDTHQALKFAFSLAEDIRRKGFERGVQEWLPF